MKYGIKRRWILVGAVLLAFGIPSTVPASDDPVALVRDVYSRAATLGANALPERDFLALLSAELRKAWQLRGKPAGNGAGVRTAVFGPGAGAGRSVAVQRVTNIPGLPKERIVAVEFTSGTEARQVFVHLAPDAGRWTIVNIIYDEGDDFRQSAERFAKAAG
ncbi:hypothetical protein [Blastochloris viridis]|uniref:DUF3828 domain-containing protein n=1 Tax=Blastochloris viridis TaxID=1079 RepID=A0A0H5BAT6_BLAVI|nr:hypothetical protein [Blastochloris viridis]ALK10732.1 hypothetical protein BVIR_2969 [Blastochloris viridis]BAR99300.1 hypothetical protein BV133_1707 [Blastochloris viridis]CUU43394.1 hypothetical protein BVIRIDIS_24130 [Blastochloris viridis]